MRETISTLLYGLHVIVHPFDGFWTLKRWKKKSVSAACIILFLALLTVFARVQLVGFLFSASAVNPEDSNVLMDMLALVAPLGMWVVLNWSITTLFDGKGKMHEIFVFTCYSLLPMILIELPMVAVSHALSLQEAVFYTVAEVVAMIWTVFLILAGSVSVHDYTMFKSIVTGICTLLGIAASVFLMMVVYSAVSQLINFFITIVTEIKYW